MSLTTETLNTDSSKEFVNYIQRVIVKDLLNLLKVPQTIC